MADPTPSRPAGDSDLLLGTLALQVNFITREALDRAVHAWAGDRSRPLGRVLVEQGGLDEEELTLVEALVAKHLRLHDNDPAKALERLRRSGAGLGSILARLETLPATAPPAAADEPRTGTPACPGGGWSAGTLTWTAGRYRVLRPHARGGLGEVLLAHDEELHRDVALKQIQERYADSAENQSRFLLEAEITGGLEHPGVVPIYGLGRHPDGRPFYAMRFIKGDSLKDAIDRFHEAERPGRDPGERSIEFRKLLGRFVAVCDAVAYAHSRGVLHRDLKPANVMLGPYGETLVVDWGLAKPVGRTEGAPFPGDEPLRPVTASGSAATQAGTVLGTPQYLSPEQAAGQMDALGLASDVYSLGATLYHLLTGKCPLQDEDVIVVLMRVQEGDVPPPRQVNPGVPPALEAVCRKAMALRPADRYASARALADDVEHWLAGEPVSAYPEPWAARVRRWAGRHRTAVTAAAATTVVAALVLAVAAGLLQRARTEAEAHARRAEDNLQAARRAVHEHFTLVSEDELSREPGTQPLRRKLLRAALAYYRDFLNQRQDDPALRAEVADARLRVGDITAQIGSKEEALAESQQARALYEDLARGTPGDTALRAGRAKSDYQIGLLRSETGRSEEAQRSYERAVAEWQELAADNPGVSSFRADLALAHHALANLLQETGRSEEALRSYGRALAIREKLARDEPAVTRFQQDLAATYNNIALVHHEAGRPAEALPPYRQALAIREKLARDNPAVSRLQSNLAASYGNIGEAQKDLGSLSDAIRCHRQGLAIREKLARDNPAVTHFQAELALSYNNLGNALCAIGRADEGMHYYEQAVGIRERMARENAGAIHFQAALAGGYTNIGGTHCEAGRPAEGLPWFRKALAIQEKLAQDNPAVADLQSNLADTYDNISEAQRALGRPAEALSSSAQALAIREKLAREHAGAPRFQKELTSTRLGRAMARAQVGEYEPAAAEAQGLAGNAAGSGSMLYQAACVFSRRVPAAGRDEKLAPDDRARRAEEYARRALAFLERARRAGHFRARAEIDMLTKSSDLAPLRERDDFRRFRATVEKADPPKGK
jgi:serine/threonine-protein kinase